MIKMEEKAIKNIYHVVSYRLHCMEKKLRDKLELKNTVQEHICPNCNRRYTDFDAQSLISPNGEHYNCESCSWSWVPVAESDTASRRHHEKLKDMLGKMEERLKPLFEQLRRVKDLPVPEFGSLQAWKLRSDAALAHMPYVGETKVEVAFSGIDGKGDVKSVSNAPTEPFPPWMITGGMNLTKEQHGETKPETKMSDSLTSLEPSDDKNSTTVNDDTKNVPVSVGWEEDLPTGNISENNCKVNVLNKEAEASEDEEDGTVWEEG